MIIYRRYSESSSDWFVNLDDSALPELGYDRNYLRLNTDGAVEGANGNISPSVAPDNSAAITDTIYSIGGDLNESGKSYINYLWTSIPGYSKIGSYVGDGRSDRFATFIYTGFRPAFVLLKRASSAASWVVHDNKRAGYNGDNDYLHPDLSQAESDGSSGTLDLVSNGFNMRISAGTHNDGTFLYMAIAEQPNGTIFGIDSDAR